MPIKHKKVSGIPDSADPDIIQPSDWNEDHEFDGLEPSLGNPTTDWQVLASSVSGIRSWVDPQSGPEGQPGADGLDGYTPVKGVDYFDGDPGPQGEAGPQGETGPNEVSTSTDTAIEGLLKGDSGKVAQAEAGVDYVETETDPIFAASEAASFAAGDKDKLDGIEAGAEVNNISDTDATDLTNGAATTLHKHDHGGLDGLGDDDHTQYALIAGRLGTGVVTRDGNGFISAVSLSDGRNYEITRDGSKYITSITNGIRTWIFTRNGENCITGWEVI